MLKTTAILLKQFLRLITTRCGKGNRVRGVTITAVHLQVDILHLNMLYKEPTRCNFGSIVY